MAGQLGQAPSGAGGSGRGPHYGWAIVGACLLMLFCTSFVSLGMSVILMGMREQAGLTGTQTSLIVTIRSVSAFVLTLLAERYYSAFGQRRGMALAMCLEALAFLAFRMGLGWPGMAPYWLGAVLAGASYAYGLMLPTSILMKRWFRKDLTLALSVAAMGTGLCSVVGSPVVEALVASRGLSATYLCLCVLILACAAVVHAVVRDRPADLGLEPVGGLGWHDPAAPHREGSAQKPYLSRAWIWATAGATLLLGVAGSPPSTHLALLFSTEGIDPAVAALGMSAFGFVLVAGKAVYGIVDGRVGTARASAAFGAAATLGLYLCSQAHVHPSASFMLTSCLVFGMGQSAITLGYPVWAADFSPRGAYVRNLSLCQLGYQAGAMLGSPLPGIFADSTGSYAGAYYLFSLAYLASTFIVWCAYRAYSREVAKAEE